ncbi:unnamed protein product [Anisakis simplex]|uniref:POD-1 (inferred by orthology to a C. elegans protein) n=1 Tax=Anisakis simplex TaxID=6269 RepID=A0A0M3J3Z9_ANISI|nr:unnamed protein product [Anisakis simplex]
MKKAYLNENIALANGQCCCDEKIENYNLKLSILRHLSIEFLGMPQYSRKKLLESPRAARILFVCNDAMIVIVHFARSSNRVITLVDSSTLEVKHTHQFDTSPQPLIPHYDFDSSVLFLTSKGDRFINMFEVIPTDPYLLPMASASFPNGHQAISLHPKIVCDVKAVEFQRGWRLTEKSMERISFRVPRVKKDLFQSDIFPRALATWIPVMSASNWFDGNYQPRLFVDLCPEDMQPYIASPQPAVRRSILQPQPRSQSHTHPQQQLISDGNAKSPTAPNGFASTVPQTPSDIGECRAEALRGAVDPNERKIVEMSWSNRIGVDLTLEQDRMQGVDEEEWYEDL